MSGKAKIIIIRLFTQKFTDPWDKERLGSSVGVYKGDGLWIQTT